MKAVLRLALAHASMLPLQKWVTLAGVVLLLGAIPLGIMARDPRGITTMLGIGLTGAAFIALAPAMLGGVALRFASSRTTLNLRPHSHVRLLAATLLAITVLAAVIALPAVLSMFAARLHGFDPYTQKIVPHEVFAAAWAAIAVIWLVVFFMCRSQFLFIIVMLLPPLFVQGISMLRQSDPASPAPGVSAWVAIAAVAWVLFILWYRHARSIAAPRWFDLRSTRSPETSFLGSITSLMNPSSNRVTLKRAISQLLVNAKSPFHRAMTSVGPVVAIIFLFSLMSLESSQARTLTPALIFGPFVGVFFGFLITCRSRNLWLRAGSNRATLFSLAERHGLSVAMYSAGLIALALLARAALGAPEEYAPWLWLALTQVPAWAALFYFGLSLTSAWSAREVLRGVVLIMLFAIHVKFTTDVAMPRAAGSGVTTIIIAFVSVLAAVALRFHAAHRWMTADWRITVNR